MRFAQQRLAVWELSELWHCPPWEVAKRPASEIFEALDYLAAKSQVERMQRLRQDMQNKRNTKHTDI